MALNKIERRKRIHYRIRKVVNGTAERPRMVVFRSNKQIYVQVVDDLRAQLFVQPLQMTRHLQQSARARLVSRQQLSSERRSQSAHSQQVSLLSHLTVVVTSIMEELKVWQTLPVKVA